MTYSSLHVSGQQLNQLSGIAAILRYPLPDLDQLELDAMEHQKEFDDESESDDSETNDHDPDWRIKEDMEDMGL